MKLNFIVKKNRTAIVTIIIAIFVSVVGYWIGRGISENFVLRKSDKKARINNNEHKLENRMKERFIKFGNKTKMIAGALALAALMAVNVQLGMNEKSTTDFSLFGLEASVSAPAAVATGSSGSCCPETRSKCYIDGELKHNNHYFQSDGPCNQ